MKEITAWFSLLFLPQLTLSSTPGTIAQIDDSDVVLPTKCESCRLMASEIEASTATLNWSKSKSDLQLWLMDELDDVCPRLLRYKVHKGVTGIARFSKDSSESMKVLKKLRDQGIQVELGVPEDLWEAPTVETQLLQRHCEAFIEDFEDDIEAWFAARMQGKKVETLEHVLCRGKVAKKIDPTCAVSPASDEL